MNKKYLTGVSVAVIAIIFAVFVAVNNKNDSADTTAVKGASTSEMKIATTDKKDKATSNVEAPAAATTGDSQAVADTAGANNYVPADQKPAGGRGGNDAAVLAIVTKPAETTTAPAPEAPAPTPETPAPVTPTPVTPAPVTPTPTPVTPTPAPTPTPTPTTGNLVANPSVEDGTTTPTGWTFGNYGTTATGTYDTAAGYNSARSLKVDVTAVDATAPGDAKWLSGDIAVTAGQTYQISDSYKSTGTSQVDILFKGAGMPDLYTMVGAAAASADWAQYSSSFVVPTGYTTAVVFHAITTVGSLSTDNYSVTLGASTTPTPTPTPTPVPGTGFTGGRVSLTFDDGLLSTYQNGAPILEKYKMVSTQYWISDTLLNNANYDGDYMTIAQAQDFLARIPGTEVGSHTVYHCDLVGATTDDATNCPTGLSPSAQATKNSAELAKSKADLESIFGAGTVTNFASPYGSYDAAAVTEIQGAGYASHRSVEAGFNTFGTYNKYDIQVQNVEATTTVAQVKAWVDQAVATNTWLVLVYHDVTVGAPGAYGVTATDLDAHLAYIQLKGVKVETVASALAGN